MVPYRLFNELSRIAMRSHQWLTARFPLDPVVSSRRSAYVNEPARLTPH